LTRKIPLIILLALLSYLGSAQEWTMSDITQYEKFEDLEPQLHINNDTTYVYNFWATWCGPCVKELPYFEAVAKRYQNEKFKMILVSLDMKKQIESKLIPFLNKHRIVSEVVLLVDGKAHKWIDKVDPSWSGAIPITLVVSGGESHFYEREFHSEQELLDIINPVLK